MPKNKKLKEIVADNVALILREKKVSQPKVVAAAKRRGFEINQTTLSRVARAKYPATVDTIEAIAAGLELEPWRLFIPATTDKNFLSILKAWAVSSAAGRELLLLAAEAAIHRRDGQADTQAAA